MATKRKIGTSLRQSVSAEKQKVTENKQPTSTLVVNKPVVPEKNTQPQKLAEEPKSTVAKKTVNKPAVSKVASKPVTTTAKNNVQGKSKAPSKQQELPIKQAAKKEVAKPNNQQTGKNAAFDMLHSFSGLNNVLEQVSQVGNKLTNAFLENLNATSEQFNEYFKQLSELKDPAGFYEANMKFVNKLKAKQQEIFAKNIEIFEIFKKIEK